MKKYNAIVLSLILVLGALPVVFGEEFEETEVIGSDYVEILDELELEESNLEIEEILEEDDMEDDSFFKIRQVTYAKGFIVKEDDSDADVFRGLWIVERMIEETDTTSVEEAEIKSRKFGYVLLGAGERREKLKLELTEFGEDFAMFNLLDKEGNVVGLLDLKPKKYERIKLWFGTITIKSGNYEGTWDVSSIAKTKIIRPKIEKPSIWNIFARGQRQRAEIQERVEEILLEREGLDKDAISEVRQNFEGIQEKRIVEINRAKRIKDMPRVADAITKKVDATRASELQDSLNSVA